MPVRASDGDVASLGDTFNKMILQLKSQRNEILSAKDLVDERRRFSEAVLEGVTAGVIGVDPNGVINIVNRSAELMLAHLGAGKCRTKPIQAPPARRQGIRDRPRLRQAGLSRAGHVFPHRNGRTFNVQVTHERADQDAVDMFVVTVDDITDLVTAQRTSDMGRCCPAHCP